jgi:hypothetical protein
MHRLARLVALTALLGLSCTQELSAARPPTSSPPAPRWIIRNADLAVEGDDPARTQQRAIAVVEQLGGFVLSSDAVSAGRETGPAELRIDLVLRVPAAKFEAALAELRQLGHGARREQVTGQDVSEEYIDLEARIRTQRALEAQLLEILKSTRAVGDMMEVHTHLAEVRGEIEKMEGRRRFLDDRTSLSTIRLEISASPSRGGERFGYSLRRAADDVVAVASGIVTVAIRLAGVLLPVLVMILLPAYAATRVVLRRRASRRDSRL